MISVINITNRPGGIDIMWANMKRQTLKDWELIIVDGYDREKEVKEYINDPRLKYVKQSKKRDGAYTNLAHADNEAFREAKGELLVCVQDYIWIPPDGLEKYWFNYKNVDNRGLFTGCGHQYAKPGKEDMTDPEGKITVFKEPYKQKPEGVIWEDPRMVAGRPILSMAHPVEWELNYASIPREIIYELGGMDEQYDFEGFAWDNTDIATRAQLMGCNIYLDLSNECYGFHHDGWWPNPLKVNKVAPAEYYHRKIKEIQEGKRPIKEKYL